MATTDNAIIYDIKIIEQFAKYLDYDKTDVYYLKKFAERGHIQRDRIIEEAIASVAGYKIVSIDGQDFCDGSDAKSVTSSWRNNIINRGVWTHSFKVPKITTKTGTLRVVGYDKFSDDYYYFAIPNEAYAHLKTLEIVIEKFHGKYDEPKLSGPKRHLKWWEYECETFEEMAKKQFS